MSSTGMMPRGWDDWVQSKTGFSLIEVSVAIFLVVVLMYYAWSWSRESFAGQRASHGTSNAVSGGNNPLWAHGSQAAGGHLDSASQVGPGPELAAAPPAPAGTPPAVAAALAAAWMTGQTVGGGAPPPAGMAPAMAAAWVAGQNAGKALNPDRVADFRSGYLGIMDTDGSGGDQQTLAQVLAMSCPAPHPDAVHDLAAARMVGSVDM